MIKEFRWRSCVDENDECERRRWMWVKEMSYERWAWENYEYKWRRQTVKKFIKKIWKKDYKRWYLSYLNIDLSIKNNL